MSAETARKPWIGRSIERHEDAALLTGSTRFMEDFGVAPGTLHVAFVGSPHAHRRISAIATAEALTCDGVHAVITGTDIAAVEADARITALDWEQIDDCRANLRTAFAEPPMLLSGFLRHELGATGTHIGCERGVCGAWTIQLNGEPARACLTLAVQAEGRRLDTVEGLGEEHGRLGILRTCFRRRHALKCGFCAGTLASLHLSRVAPGSERSRPACAALRPYLPLHRLYANHHGCARRGTAYA